MPTAIVYGLLLDDASEPWPGRVQLMHAMARKTQVVFLERAPGAASGAGPVVERLDEHALVIRNAFPLLARRRVRRLPGVVAAEARTFRRVLADAGISDAILWLSGPDPGLARVVSADRLVYDCIDPNFLPGHEEAFDAAELAVARRAQLVFATAETLLDRMRAANPQSFLLPNATWPRPRTAHAERPEPLRSASGPIIGYLGTVDWRFDVDAVAHAAHALPGCTFAIVGRINREREQELRVLGLLPNVVLPGPVDDVTGNAYTDAFDVGLIPFKPGPMNDAINPVKMYMYLAQGIPVVATDIAECRHNPLVRTGAAPPQLVAAIEAALADRDEFAVRRRIAFGQENTWAHRAADGWRILQEHGLVTA